MEMVGWYLDWITTPSFKMLLNLLPIVHPTIQRYALRDQKALYKKSQKKKSQT
jgi:hypothetical protein